MTPHGPPAIPVPKVPAGVAHDAIPRIFDVGLILAACRSLVDEPVAARLRQAMDHLDALADDLRAAALADGRSRREDPRPSAV